MNARDEWVSVTPGLAAFSEEEARKLVADLDAIKASARIENLRVGGEATCHWSVMVPSRLAKREGARLAGFVDGWRVGYRAGRYT